MACRATSLVLMWDLISAHNLAFSASRFCSSVCSSVTVINSAVEVAPVDVDGRGVIVDDVAARVVACCEVIVAVGGGNLGLMINGVFNCLSVAALICGAILCADGGPGLGVAGGSIVKGGGRSLG